VSTGTGADRLERTRRWDALDLAEAAEDTGRSLQIWERLASHARTLFSEWARRSVRRPEGFQRARPPVRRPEFFDRGRRCDFCRDEVGRKRRLWPVAWGARALSDSKRGKTPRLDIVYTRSNAEIGDKETSPIVPPGERFRWLDVWTLLPFP